MSWYIAGPAPAFDIKCVGRVSLRAVLTQKLERTVKDEANR